MKERTVNHNMAVPADHQAAVVAKPGEGAFHLPTPPVSPQFAAVLRFAFSPFPAMRADQLNPAPLQPFPQRVAVVPLVGDEPLRIFPRPPATLPRHRDLIERLFQERHFRRTGRVQVVSQRNTLAVDHHHPLRALAAFGRADAGAPFFAGANEPSAKVSDQSRWPFWSNSPRKARQIVSQTSCSSQSRNRRQQVLGDGNSVGRSFHRAPLRSTQRMPSSTRRLSTGLRPPRGDRFGFGSNGSIFCHCASVSNRYRAIDPPFDGRVNHKPIQGASLKQNQF